MAGASPVEAPFVITNVIPGDYDYDGRLDLLLMGEDSPGGWWSTNELKMVLYQGMGRGQFCKSAFPHLRKLVSWLRLLIDAASPTELPSSQIQQPTPFDAGGNMKVDLLGYPFGDDKQQNLKVWQNSWQESNHTQMFTL